MRLEEAEWVGPTTRVLESRRAALPKLERETELLPEILEGLRQGRRSWALRASRELPKKAQKIVQSGPISTIEERLGWARSRALRCRATLEIGDGEELRQDVLSQVPPIAPPPGLPSYGELERGQLRFAHLSIEADADQLALSLDFPASRDRHRYSFAWDWTGDATQAKSLKTDARFSVPESLFEATKTAAAEHLAKRGLEPFIEAGEPVWTLEAPRKGSRFDRSRPVSWRVGLRCEGPTHGGVMPGAAWQGYGMEYRFEYDPASGEVELEVRGWNT